MRFLLDTNAVSEPTRPAPNRGFLGWLQDRDAEELGTSILVIGELRRGAGSLPPSSRRRGIETWLAQCLSEFGSRVLPVDLGVSAAWADVTIQHRQAGRVVGAVDELIAATAIASNLTLVTRNLRDFQYSGCKLLCPWTA